MKYVLDPKLQDYVKMATKKLGLNYIDPGRVRVVRSSGSRSRNTVARIHGMPKAIQVALSLESHYVIEILSERFDALDEEAKKKVILHELLHIPVNFGGGVVNHGSKDFDRLEGMYSKRLVRESDEVELG